MNDESEKQSPHVVMRAIIKRFPIDGTVSCVFAPLVFLVVVLTDSLELRVPVPLYAALVVWLSIQRGREMSTMRRNQLELVPTESPEVDTPKLGMLHGIITAISCAVAYWIAIRYCASQ